MQVRLPWYPPGPAQLLPSLPVVQPLLIFPTGGHTKVEVPDPSLITQLFSRTPSSEVDTWLWWVLLSWSPCCPVSQY